MFMMHQMGQNGLKQPTGQKLVESTSFHFISTSFQSKQNQCDGVESTLKTDWICKK
jgi:hypothetical protein